MCDWYFLLLIVFYSCIVVSPDVRDVYFGSLDGTFEGFTFVDDSAEKMLLGHVGQGQGSHNMHQGPGA